MIPIRQSSATESNKSLQKTRSPEGQTNHEWLRAHDLRAGVILLGGCSVSHFLLRVAQAHLRHDLTPSYWSQAGILLDEETFFSVPLDLPGELSALALINGVQRCAIDDYDDPELFPNIAVIRFPADTNAIYENARRIRAQRSIVDLLALSLPWVAYVLGVGQSANPLLGGGGIPSAVFVETAYGMSGVELTPGLSSSTSCPEAIWQSAKWWHSFYEKDSIDRRVEKDVPQVPTGNFLLRQPAAAALEPKSEDEQREPTKRSRRASAAKGASKSAAKKIAKRSSK